METFLCNVPMIINFALELFWIHRHRCSWCWKHPRFKMSSQLKMIFLSAFIASPQISQAVCFIHTYVTFTENISSPIIFLITAMKPARFFLTNLLKIQISYAVCNHFSLTTFFINFFLLSLKRKWQVPSATVNRVTFHKSSMNCLSCSNAAENSSKWFIHQERKTNFCP